MEYSSSRSVPGRCSRRDWWPSYARRQRRGDLYVAYEHNWATNLFGRNDPVQNVMNYIPFSCLDIAKPANVPTSSCSGPTATKAVNIVSMDGAFIPGYNRFPMNDFPRLAVSDPFRAISMV